MKQKISILFLVLLTLCFAGCERWTKPFSRAEKSANAPAYTNQIEVNKPAPSAVVP